MLAASFDPGVFVTCKDCGLKTHVAKVSTYYEGDDGVSYFMCGFRSSYGYGASQAMIDSMDVRCKTCDEKFLDALDKEAAQVQSLADEVGKDTSWIRRVVGFIATTLTK